MGDDFVSSDLAILDLLRKHEALTVAEMSDHLDVTATAVRQRLNRLLAQRYIEREAERHGRGRPTHRYHLTEKGARKAGSNFADLAVALWQEIRAIEDAQVRQGLLQRVAKRLAVMYADRFHGDSLDDRIRAIMELFAERRVPLDLESPHSLPVLKAGACPYPDLAESDRSVCAMERLLLTELLGTRVRLDECRLDGDSCCTFQVSESEAS
jgi:DeoR family suf operon transcriptional repressor